MCGIVGYIGAGKTTDVLLDSLGRLEYRGYDSAGIALVCEDGLEVIKSAERIVKLKEQVPVDAVRDRGHRPHALGHPWQAIEDSTPTRTRTVRAASPSSTTASSRTTRS